MKISLIYIFVKSRHIRIPYLEFTTYLELMIIWIIYIILKSMFPTVRDLRLFPSAFFEEMYYTKFSKASSIKFRPSHLNYRSTLYPESRLRESIARFLLQFWLGGTGHNIDCFTKRKSTNPRGTDWEMFWFPFL